VVSDGSGFVLILVLPVALLLIMTALSLVTRSNSASLASTREARAQAARMAAEYGFNQVMAQLNTQYDYVTNRLNGNTNQIPDSPGSSYAIVWFVPPPPPGTACSTYDASDNVQLIVEGTYTVNSVDYKRKVIRNIRVCAPALNKLRVRGFK